MVKITNPDEPYRPGKIPEKIQEEKDANQPDQVTAEQQANIAKEILETLSFEETEEEFSNIISSWTTIQLEAAEQEFNKLIMRMKSDGGNDIRKDNLESFRILVRKKELIINQLTQQSST